MVIYREQQTSETRTANWRNQNSRLAIGRTVGCLSQTANENRFDRFLNNRQNFRKFCPTRPERAEAPSPGHRPGLLWAQTCRPVRAKAFKYQAINKAFALTGRLADCYYTQGDALGQELLPFQGVWGHTGRVELTCENLITEISHRFRLISEKKKKN